MKSLFIFLMSVVTAYATTGYYQDRVTDRHGTGQYNRVVQLRDFLDSTTTDYSDTTDVDGVWGITAESDEYFVYVDSERVDRITVLPNVRHTHTVGQNKTDTITFYGYVKADSGNSFTVDTARAAWRSDTTRGGAIRARSADTARASSISDSTKGGSIRSRTSALADSAGGAIRSRTAAVADSCKGKSVTAVLADSAKGAIRSRTSDTTRAAIKADTAQGASRLDGLDGSAYATLAGNNKLTGLDTITGNLVVNSLVGTIKLQTGGAVNIGAYGGISIKDSASTGITINSTAGPIAISQSAGATSAAITTLSGYAGLTLASSSGRVAISANSDSNITMGADSVKLTGTTFFDANNAHIDTLKGHTRADTMTITKLTATVSGTIDSARASNIADSAKGGSIRARSADTSRASNIADSSKGGAVRARTAALADSTTGGAVRARSADTSRAAGTATTASSADSALYADSALCADSSFYADSTGMADSALYSDSAGMSDSALYADSSGMADSALFADSAAMADSALFADSSGMSDSSMFADSGYFSDSAYFADSSYFSDSTYFADSGLYADTAGVAEKALLADSTTGGAVRARSADTSRAAGSARLADTSRISSISDSAGGTVRLAGLAGSAYAVLANNQKFTGLDTMAAPVFTNRVRMDTIFVQSGSIVQLLNWTTQGSKIITDYVAADTFRGQGGAVGTQWGFTTNNNFYVIDTLDVRHIVVDSAYGKFFGRVDTALIATLADSTKGGSVRLAGLAGSAYGKYATAGTWSTVQTFSDSIKPVTTKTTNISVTDGTIKSSTDTALVLSSDDVRVDGVLTVRESLYVTTGARCNTNMTVDDSLSSTSQYARRSIIDTLYDVDSIDVNAAYIKRAFIDSIKKSMVVETLVISSFIQYIPPYGAWSFSDSGTTCAVGAATDTNWLTNTAHNIFKVVDTVKTGGANDTFYLRTAAPSGDYNFKGAIVAELDANDSITVGIMRIRAGVKSILPGKQSIECVTNNTSVQIVFWGHDEDAAAGDKYIVFIKNKSAADIKLESGHVELSFFYR